MRAELAQLRIARTAILTGKQAQSVRDAAGRAVTYAPVTFGMLEARLAYLERLESDLLGVSCRRGPILVQF